MKKRMILFIVILLLLPGCIRPTESGNASENVSSINYGVRNGTESETIATRLAEEEDVRALEIAPWGTVVSVPDYENYSLLLRELEIYDNLNDSGISSDALSHDPVTPNPGAGEGEEEMYHVEDLIAEDGSVAEGYQLILLDVEITNLQDEESPEANKVNLSGVVLTRPEAILIMEDEEMVALGVKYFTNYIETYRVISIIGAMDTEKDGFAVAITPGDKAQVKLAYLVPEDISELIGVVACSGDYSGGFFSLQPETS